MGVLIEAYHASGREYSGTQNDLEEVDSSLSDDTSDSDTDSDDGGYFVNRRSVSIKDLLYTIYEGIRRGTRDLTRADQLASFEAADGDYLASSTGSSLQPTALHIMASEEKKVLPKLDSKMEPLIKFLVQHGNDLLRQRDKSGHTPLYLAIEAKKEIMVRWMCEAHSSIDTVLAIPSITDQRNCLHVGIDKRVKFLQALVERANPETLAAKDHYGNTPLHLAVEYKNCRKDQLAVIEWIVDKSDEAVHEASRDGDFNQAGLSPYLHHKESVSKAEARDVAKRGAEKATDKNDGGRTNTSSTDAGVPPARSAGMGRKRVAQPPDTPSDQHGPGGGQPVGQQATWEEMYGQILKAQLPPGTYGLPRSFQGEQDDAEKNTAPKQPVQTTKLKGSVTESIRESTPTSKVDKDTVTAVERFLKLHYLRSRSHDVAMEILYGRDTTSEKELFFDLSGCTSITQRGLNNLLKKLKFEDTLQYVAIPRLSIEADINTANSKRPRAGGLRSNSSTDGSSDLRYIFNSLREKGVKAILKVIVDDLVMPAHSDEAIEKALNVMNVEVWNWRRTDLCSEVVHTVAPRVRELHLYWSGNNSVLRGWSEEGGLKRLKELNKVHLHVQQGLESSARTQRNVDQFHSRMEKLCPEVTIIKQGSSIRQRVAVQADGGPVDQSTKHEWIQCMKEFQRLLFDAEKNYVGRGIAASIEEPIKVAIIDDGVDVTDLEYTFIGGRSFCTRDDDHNLSDPYYASRTGHGTIMAQQIYLLCPRAQFYVLRLEDHDSEEAGRQVGASRQITARSAARAIRAAVKKGVHIISMSWNIDDPEDDADRQDLESSVAEAAKADILMFCSASDKGGGKQIATYPAKATARIFTIGAATSSGNAAPWVGNLDNISFTFPGSKVELGRGGSGGGPAVAREVTGSSVATALAAGLAALVLYCLQVRVLLAATAQEKEKAGRDFQALKKHENMLKALKDIGTTAESNHKFIEVWEVFGKKVEEKERHDQDRWIELIAEVGSTLCRKM